MVASTAVLAATAFSIALVHTASGPDHYLPFLVLGRSEKWPFKKILFYTLLGGVAHVSSSILVGALGIALGWSAGSIEWFEGVRGNIAIWGLVAVGVAYMLFGFWKAGQNNHTHENSGEHSHIHDHTHFFGMRISNSAGKKTVVALLVVFLLGPCEPLIPVLLVPAASHSIGAILVVTAVFIATTLLTLAACVTLAYAGIGLFEFNVVKRYIHVFSGMTIAFSGLLLIFLS